MGFFDQIGKKASDTMQSAKEKTNKFSTEMKLKSQISDKKDRITVLYSEIGKEVYSNYTKGINENSETIIAKANEISHINEELESLNKELLELKGVKICTSCGAQIVANSEFCPKCGTKIVEIVQTIPETVRNIESQEIKDENQENNNNQNN